MLTHPCSAYRAGNLGWGIFISALTPRKIIFSQNFTSITPHNGGGDVITVKHFDKRTYCRARTKTKKVCLKLFIGSVPLVAYGGMQFSNLKTRKD